MKRRLRFKKFLLFLCISTVCFGFCLPSIASSVTETATLIYRDKQIILNGEAVTPKDAKGNIVEPFIINGTTYLPVRAIASALDMEVSWDDSTSTITLVQAQIDASSGKSVYITKTGKKYHYDGTCNGGKYFIVPYETAIGFGLDPCNKCVQ